MRECVITGAARTAVGGYCGGLKTVEAKELGACVIREAARRSGLEPRQLDQVILGDVYGYTPNVARVSALLAGVPVETPAYTVDRQCASSLQAVVNAAQEIAAGDADIVLAGGVETMSRMVYYLPPSTRYEPPRLGDVTLYDTFVKGVTLVQPPEMYPGLNMGLTAENLAVKYAVSREDQDRFAFESQMKTKAAMEAGCFREEIVPFEVKLRKSGFVFDTDEHPRPETTLESLAKLKPTFKRDGTGTVTAGNASGMNDGASAVVVMSSEKAERSGIAPMARILAYTYVGVEPSLMGIGPAPAIRKACEKAKLRLEDIDLFEINEAFAAQSVAVLRELGMDRDSPLYSRVNVLGGAIAHGHALANSGTRLLTTMLYEMKRNGQRYGVVSLCIGGGQGMARVLENMQ